MAMKGKKDKFYLVNEVILPEAIKKTIKVKSLVQVGDAQTIKEAVEKLDLSRSAYYKYKDYVFPFYELSQGKIVSINALISNESGMLSNILRIIADYNGSVLTINQNLPLQGVAHVNISFETKELTLPVEDVLHEVRQLEGVIKVELIGQA